MALIDEIVAIYRRHGDETYFGECVSMTEHGLQAAWFAQVQGAPEPLIIAALLHDIGHLLEPVPDDLADWKEDARHEEVGAIGRQPGRDDLIAYRQSALDERACKHAQLVGERAHVVIANEVRGPPPVRRCRRIPQ